MTDCQSVTSSTSLPTDTHTITQSKDTTENAGEV